MYTFCQFWTAPSPQLLVCPPDRDSRRREPIQFQGLSSPICLPLTDDGRPGDPFNESPTFGGGQGGN